MGTRKRLEGSDNMHSRQFTVHVTNEFSSVFQSQLQASD